LARDEIVDWLAGIVFGGVAITTTALQTAVDGQELTFTQWRAIVRVGEQANGCRVGEVAARLNAALPATSRLLRRLERRGLLTLERDEGDRRATRARLTDSGATLRSSVLAYRKAEIAAIVDQVRPSTAADRVLRDLASRFDARGQYGSAPAPELKRRARNSRLPRST
jgi:DNA-binding MarR family transcriptional regulator